MKYFLLIILMLGFACTESDDVFEIDSQTIFFQFEYTNEAWVHQHKGFLIDSEGNIYDYELPENWVWQEEGKISRDDFIANLNQTEIRTGLIDGNELNAMLALALKVEEGELSEKKNIMADAGAEVYAIYIVNESDNSLGYHLLQMRGDSYQKNLSSAADNITEWLIGIRGEQGFNDEPFNE